MTAPGHTPGLPSQTATQSNAQAISAEMLSAAVTGPVAAITGSVSLPLAVSNAKPARFFGGSPVLRRVVFVIGYEGFSLLFTIFVLGMLLGHGGANSTLTAVLLTLTATGWNYLWNMIFEAIERRSGITHRGPLMRAIHAFGYEGGVLIFTIPLVAITLGVSLLEAFVIESSLLVFFLIFTVVYTWAFDKVCGLPSAE
ncbi:PACE efflux transporter [Leucobacter sp. 1207-22]|uniref:PACE efflux transporter n=1 Tax=Leucobacter sp. 1207-22 TaxID=2604456 RepID=UPI004062EAE7